MCLQFNCYEAANKILSSDGAMSQKRPLSIEAVRIGDDALGYIENLSSVVPITSSTPCSSK